ncbi:MAG TPA: PilZ domain-containing protein [Pyrinomonadaceae bacterium]|nr:PilZ domain-containing protein [Pyrinomonadaceae bacterium]
MTDRRRAERVETSLEAHWEGVLTRLAGTIVDLSATGCFILTADQVRPNELIRLEISMPETTVCLWGEVVYKIPEIGFGVRFTGADAAEEAVIKDYVLAKRSTAGSRQ